MMRKCDDNERRNELPLEQKGSLPSNDHRGLLQASLFSGGGGDYEVGGVVPNTSRSKGGASGVAFDVKFVQSAFLMLEDCSQDHSDVISWTREGDAIEVKNIETLESTILPRYFNSSKYSSFVRQLNKYDFKRRKPELTSRHTSGVVRDIFEHEFFQKGQRNLLTKVKRKEIHPSNTKKLGSDEEVQSLKRRLESLEEGQTRIFKAIRRLEEAMDEKKTNKSQQQQEATTNEAIQRLEYRLRSVEGCLFSLMSNSNQRYNNPRQQQQHHHTYSWSAGVPPNLATALVREESSWRTDPFPTTDPTFPSLQRFPSAPPLRLTAAEQHTTNAEAGLGLDQPNHDHEMKDLFPGSNESTTANDNDVHDIITRPTILPLSRDNTFDSKIRSLNLDIMDHDGTDQV